jgi:hypothetical protein
MTTLFDSYSIIIRLSYKIFQRSSTSRLHSMFIDSYDPWWVRYSNIKSNVTKNVLRHIHRLVFIHNEIIYISANREAIFRNVKYKFSYIKSIIIIKIIDIISFHNFNAYNLRILHHWRWPHGWPKHVVVHGICKLNQIYLCAFLGTVIIYNFTVSDSI